MTILPEDLRIEEYGLKGRLITEDDASFIVGLRSDKKRTKYMVTLEPDVENQKSWIREYKIRERKGEDYFFIYRNSSDEPISIGRISNIDFIKSDCKFGGWITVKGSRLQNMLTFLLYRKIIFEVLHLSSFHSDIHKNNKKALSYFEELDFPPPYKEKGGFLYFKVFFEDHRKANKILEQKYLLNL